MYVCCVCHCLHFCIFFICQFFKDMVTDDLTISTSFAVAHVLFVPFKLTNWFYMPIIIFSTLFPKHSLFYLTFNIFFLKIFLKNSPIALFWYQNLYNDIILYLLYLRFSQIQNVINKLQFLVCAHLCGNTKRLCPPARLLANNCLKVVPSHSSLISYCW